MEFEKMIFFAILILCSIRDVRKREISGVFVAAGILCGLFYQIVRKEASFQNIFIGCLPGISLMALAILTEGKVGFGDGLVVLMGGMYFDFFDILWWIFVSFFLCACFGGILIVLKKGNRKSELPFVPFLTVVAIIQSVIVR